MEDRFWFWWREFGSTPIVNHHGPSVTLMWSHSRHARKPRPLRRHEGLLDAWLDALNRLDGPNLKIAADSDGDDFASPDIEAAAKLRH